MSKTTAKLSRIMEILEKETHGHSYKSHKYSLDGSKRSAVEHEKADTTVQWSRRGETRKIRISGLTSATNSHRYHFLQTRHILMQIYRTPHFQAIVSTL